jgi:hypothetical protein
MAEGEAGDESLRLDKMSSSENTRKTIPGVFTLNGNLNSKRLNGGIAAASWCDLVRMQKAD